MKRRDERRVAEGPPGRAQRAYVAAFSPTDARRRADQLEIHPNPKHGSWLNIAESELSVQERQRLDLRCPDRARWR